MNSLVRTSVISAEPVSLLQMKKWLKVPLQAIPDDTDITDLITEAREHCELLSNCALVRSNFVQYLDHFPDSGMRESNYLGTGSYGGSGHDGLGYDRHHRFHGEIKIKRPPLISVQSIWFIGTDGRPYTLNPGQDFVVDCASQPGRIRPIPYTVWPLTLHVPAAIAIKYTAGYAPNSDGIAAGQPAIVEPESLTSSIAPSWQPSKVFAQYAYQVDQSGDIWIQTAAGTQTTGTTRPNFEAQPISGTIPTDGSAAWLNVGPLRGFWTPGTSYSGLQTYAVLDFNSNLQLLNVASLVSQPIPAYSLQTVGASPLPWATGLGALTADNGIMAAWRCLGPYNALGNTGLASPPNSPEQQAAVTVDRTLPKVVTRAIKALVQHWYVNREPVTPGMMSKVPLHIEDMLGSVHIEDFAPTP